MDNTAQDFARKIVSKLDDLGHLVQSLLALKDGQKPPSPTGSTNPSSSSQPAPPFIGGLIPKTGESNSKDEKKERREISKFRLEKAGAGVLVIYTVFSGWQACEMRRSNEINRRALIDVQRAIISPAPIDAHEFLDKTTHRLLMWDLRAGGWENDGATAARSIRVHVNHASVPDTFPKGFSYPDEWGDNNEHEMYSETVLGPKLKLPPGDTLEMPIPAIRAFIDKHWHVTVWGWITYKDVFYPATPMRLTEFCFELYRFDGDPLGPNGEDAPPVFITCKNKALCYDEDCADYEQRIKR